MLKVFLKNSKLIFLILSAVAALFASIGYLHSGFPLTDDGNWMVIRFSAFYESLKSGQIPVRFLMRLNNGYGYPVADFLYPLFMYIGIPLHILALNFVDTIKAELILSVVCSSVFCYLWLKKFFDDFSSFVGSVVFTFFPYHLFDLYKRGSVGEVLSLAILPFVLWQIEKRSLFFVSIGISFLIMAHNSLAVLFAVFIFAYALLDILTKKDKKKLIIFYASSALLGLGLSAFFWIPAIFDLKYTVFGNTQVSEWENYFSDFSLIGYSTIFLIVLPVFLFLSKKLQISKHRLTILLLIFATLSIFFATNLSSFLWKILPVSFIQFPFRFLSLTSICIAFISAVSLSTFSKNVKIALGIIIIIFVLVDGYKYLVPRTFQYYPDEFYSTNQDSTTVKNEYMPKWVKTVPSAMYDSKVQNLNGKENINIISTNSKEMIFQTYLDSQRLVQINTVYFPGWDVYVNGIKREIDYNSNGYIRLNLDRGQNNIKVLFGETWERIFADIISILSLVCLCFYLLFKNKLKWI